MLALPRLVVRYGIDPEGVAAFFRFLDRHARLANPVPDSPVTVRDPEDAHVLATALGGGADYLVSGDDDLLTLADDARLAPVRIVTARYFLQLLPPA